MKNTTISAQDILAAILEGFAAGGVDEWDAPEFERARQLTKEKGCVWDFDGWAATAQTIRRHGELGGVVLS